MAKHEFRRVRQDGVRRTLQVAAKQQVTPRMLRIELGSDELEGFSSPSADDHIKIFLPAQAGRPAVARDFTPRAWDPRAKTLTLDFALHPRGPAVDWAVQAQAGDSLEIGGPRGSTIAPVDFDWYLLIGDATALPAIGRRIEQLPPQALMHIIALVEDQQEEAYLTQAEGQKISWLHTTGSVERDLQQVCGTLERIPPPAGDGFLWIAAEASIARGVYRYALDTLRHPKEWIKAAGYWSFGKADGGERIA